MAGCKELSDKTHIHGILTKLERTDDSYCTSDGLADIISTQNKLLICYIRQHQQNAQCYFTQFHN